MYIVYRTHYLYLRFCDETPGRHVTLYGFPKERPVETVVPSALIVTGVFVLSKISKIERKSLPLSLQSGSLPRRPGSQSEFHSLL